jgi:hypothetical protein
MKIAESSPRHTLACRTVAAPVRAGTVIAPMLTAWPLVLFVFSPLLAGQSRATTVEWYCQEPVVLSIDMLIAELISATYLT